MANGLTYDLPEDLAAAQFVWQNGGRLAKPSPGCRHGAATGPLAFRRSRPGLPVDTITTTSFGMTER